MKQRVITAAFLIAVVVPIVYFGGIAFKVMAPLFVAVGTYELLRLFDKKWSMTDKVVVYIFFIGSLLLGYIDKQYVAVAAIAFIIVLFFLLVNNKEINIEQIGLVYLVYMIFEITVIMIQYLQNTDKMFLILMLAGTYLTDTFALFCGKAFGKHKLNERISPNKTIEGTVGGYIIASVACLIFGLLCVKNTDKTMMIVACFTYSFIGQIGDLAFSAIKRHYGVKDFGNIFPGHGGVLDRIDSLTFNCLWTFCLVLLFI